MINCNIDLKFKVLAGKGHSLALETARGVIRQKNLGGMFVHCIIESWEDLDIYELLSQAFKMCPS